MKKARRSKAQKPGQIAGAASKEQNRQTARQVARDIERARRESRAAEQSAKHRQASIKKANESATADRYLNVSKGSEYTKKYTRKRHHLFALEGIDSSNDFNDSTIDPGRRQVGTKAQGRKTRPAARKTEPTPAITNAFEQKDHSGDKFVKGDIAADHVAAIAAVSSSRRNNIFGDRVTAMARRDQKRVAYDYLRRHPHKPAYSKRLA